MSEGVVRLCMYVDPARRESEPKIAKAMGERACPHPAVLDPPATGCKTRQCVSCLYDWATVHEPLIDGEWWGPVRTLAEILRR